MQDNEKTTYDNNFSVSPPAQRFNGRPGDIIEGSVKVVNYSNSKTELEYTVSILPYGVDSETHRDDFTTKNKYNIVTDWVDIVESAGVISPGESKNIHFRINIPEDAPGGGQSFVVAIGNSEEINPNAKVTSTMEIASVIYLNVDGEVVRDGDILENSVPIISFVTPVITSATFKNNGNTHLDATIRTTARNIFTGEEVYPEEEIAEKKNTIVMPEARKTVQENITHLNPIGIYNITQDIIYNGKTSTTSHLTIVCPIWICIVVLTAFIACVSFIIKKIIVRARKHSYFSI